MNLKSLLYMVVGETINKGDMRSSLSVRHREGGHEGRKPKQGDHAQLLGQHRWSGRRRRSD